MFLKHYTYCMEWASTEGGGGGGDIFNSFYGLDSFLNKSSLSLL